MRVAIVHYHLAKGGVTRVIESATRALQGSAETLVICSAPPEVPLARVAIVPELAYCTTASVDSADRLEKGLREAAIKAFGGLPDLWHFHNHGLGKNVNLPEVIRRLALDGQRLVLQIHDFAEDGRPENHLLQEAPYKAGTFPDRAIGLYPVAPQIVYALLNQRDHRLLREAGIPAGQLVWLPNAVALPVNTPASAGKSPSDLILYPTRGIRRKNLGELLLIAALSPNHRYATTLGPRNPQWLPTHQHWERLAKELGLPVDFGVCDHGQTSFEDLVYSAQALVTTSVAEGFGLAFLEPSLFSKPLVGRDLPEITADFRANGIELPGLYETWPIPLKAFDAGSLRTRYAQALMEWARSYGRHLPGETASATWEEITAKGQIDFGHLDEQAQTEVLRGIGSGKGPSIGLPLNLTDPANAHLPRNQMVIESSYGLPAYRAKLLSLYRRVLESHPAPPTGIDQEKILDGFLQPTRFRLLRA
jgi:hypothetical protein